MKILFCFLQLTFIFPKSQTVLKSFRGFFRFADTKEDSVVSDEAVIFEQEQLSHGENILRSGHPFQAQDGMSSQAGFSV